MLLTSVTSSLPAHVAAVRRVRLSLSPCQNVLFLRRYAHMFQKSATASSKCGHDRYNSVVPIARPQQHVVDQRRLHCYTTRMDQHQNLFQPRSQMSPDNNTHLVRTALQFYSTSSSSSQSQSSSPSPSPSPTQTQSPSQSSSKTNITIPSKKSMREEIKEHAKLTAEGRASQHDGGLLPTAGALSFPRIKTTSISTKCMIIADEASTAPATLVLVAFRSFADDQLKPWRQQFEDRFAQAGLRWFDVTVNESFAAQAFSGFVQRWQRGYIAPELHDYFVAFNSKVRQPLEVLLLNHNRMFGNVLLLDRQARVRFRAAGPPSPDGIDTLVKCTQRLISEDSENKSK